MNLEGVDLVGAGGDEGDRVPAFYEGDASQVYGYSWRGLLEAALLAGGGGPPSSSTESRPSWRRTLSGDTHRPGATPGPSSYDPIAWIIRF